MVRALGQMLLAAIFIKGGSDAFLQPGGRTNKVAAAGIPNPEAAVQFNGAMMVLGGAMLALDVAPKLSAAGLIASLIPTTVIGHRFWTEEEQGNRAAQSIHFLKNLGLIGGLLLVLAQKEK